MHPFHELLHGGKLNKGQVQAWAFNRYCYQSAVPRKDAALISRCHDRELRREWLHRIMDHDGYGEEEGGIERWLVLTDGLGLDRDYVISQEGRAARDEIRRRGLCEFRAREDAGGGGGVFSLTELFAPRIHKRASPACWRITISSTRRDGLFQRRLTQAPNDAEFALNM